MSTSCSCIICNILGLAVDVSQRETTTQELYTIQIQQI